MNRTLSSAPLMAVGTFRLCFVPFAPCSATMVNLGIVLEFGWFLRNAQLFSSRRSLTLSEFRESKTKVLIVVQCSSSSYDTDGLQVAPCKIRKRRKIRDIQNRDSIHPNLSHPNLQKRIKLRYPTHANKYGGEKVQIYHIRITFFTNLHIPLKFRVCVPSS